MKKLVVYYSLTCNTKNLAEIIAKSLNCDIEEIIDKKNRKGFFRIFKSWKRCIF